MTNTILLYDRNYNLPTKIYLPFAENNVLLKNLADLDNQPILNFWTMDSTVILGMADQRLNNLSAGLKYLQQNHYHYFVRNSGGLAVVTDQDVLNISLFLPRIEDLSINDAYQRMTDLIQNALPDTNITVKEIADSYCPGDFDLSINGQKFAGISQRRVQNGIVIMAYVSVTGDQNQRGQLIKNFYEQSEAASSKFTFPTVNPNAMANLDDLTNESLTVDSFKQRILDSMSKDNKFDSTTVKLYTQTTKYQANLEKALQDLQQRNAQII